MIPAPRDREAPVVELVVELAGHVGEPAVVALACELLGGADRAAYPDELVYLTRLADSDAHPAEWTRVWGARALLYVWDDGAADAVVAALDDDVWRVAEMCLKVATRHEVATAADGAVRLAHHELPRVRGHALRLLGVAGDAEHVATVRDAVDDPDEDVRRHAARALERLEQRLDLS